MGTPGGGFTPDQLALAKSLRDIYRSSGTLHVQAGNNAPRAPMTTRASSGNNSASTKAPAPVAPRTAGTASSSSTSGLKPPAPHRSNSGPYSGNVRVLPASTSRSDSGLVRPLPTQATSPNTTASQAHGATASTPARPKVTATSTASGLSVSQTPATTVPASAIPPTVATSSGAPGFTPPHYLVRAAADAAASAASAASQSAAPATTQINGTLSSTSWSSGGQTVDTSAQRVPTALPAHPVQPDQPAQPTQPAKPTQPAQPAQPSQPVQPVRSVQPVQPLQSALPVQHYQPAQPFQFNRPAQPAQPAQYSQTGPTFKFVNPAWPTQPAQTIRPFQFFQATQPSQTFNQYSQAAQAAQTAQLAQHPQPAQANQPFQFFQTAQPSPMNQFLQAAQPTQHAYQTPAAQHAQHARQESVAQPPQATQPSQPIQPAQLGQPVHSSQTNLARMSVTINPLSTVDKIEPVALSPSSEDDWEPTIQYYSEMPVPEATAGQTTAASSEKQPLISLTTSQPSHPDAGQHTDHASSQPNAMPQSVTQPQRLQEQTPSSGQILEQALDQTSFGFSSTGHSAGEPMDVSSSAAIPAKAPAVVRDAIDINKSGKPIKWNWLTEAPVAREVTEEELKVPEPQPEFDPFAKLRTRPTLMRAPGVGGGSGPMDTDSARAQGPPPPRRIHGLNASRHNK